MIDTHLKTVRKRFRTQVADEQYLKVGLDSDSEFDPPQDEAYCMLRFQVAQADQVSMGAVGNRRFRTNAFMVAEVRTPFRGGEKRAWEIANTIIAAFRGVSDTGVRFGVPVPTVIGRRGSHWQINVTCPFRFDETG